MHRLPGLAAGAASTQSTPSYSQVPFGLSTFLIDLPGVALGRVDGGAKSAEAFVPFTTRLHDHHLVENEIIDICWGYLCVGKLEHSSHEIQNGIHFSVDRRCAIIYMRAFGN
jgi:hypothetical protein